MRFCVLFFLLLLTGCASPLLPRVPASHTGEIFVEGTSFALKKLRSETVSQVAYHVSVQVPRSLAEPLQVRSSIDFDLKASSQPVVVDFRGDAADLLLSEVDGQTIALEFTNDHLVIPGLKAGHHQLSFENRTSSSALNRDPHYLATLFVPDRAEEVFPCFDQPDLRAKFTLSLKVPKDWEAVANESVESRKDSGDFTVYRFGTTPALPTYLFAFSTGEFKKMTRAEGGRSMTMYYRETDEEKVARNAPDVFSLHARAAAWMENYTGIKYPFSKFDFVVVPSLSFGGMEHPGAIFENDAEMFLEKFHTVEQEIRRASAISHEVAHLWFGDLVTIDWFDDVWLKEVLASFMSAKINNPNFPRMNHDLVFYLGHFPKAYHVDRSEGSVPIRQHLENLRSAGSLYGNIIYFKAPIAMRNLELLVGEEPFRKGIQEYLRKFSFGSASWEDFAQVMSRSTHQDLTVWSQTWIYASGRPTVTLTAKPFRFDQWDRYGLLKLSPEAAKSLLAALPSDSLSRAVAWETLWENLLEGTITAQDYVSLAIRALPQETEDLTIQFVLRTVPICYWNFLSKVDQNQLSEKLEQLIWSQMNESKSLELKKSYFNCLLVVASTDASVRKLNLIWAHKSKIDGLELSDDDEMSLSYELAVRRPALGQDLFEKEAARLTDPDRKAQFTFIFPFTASDRGSRDALFKKLTDRKERLKERWVVRALDYLHHPFRKEASREYVEPSLSLMEELADTGTISFPELWMQHVLAGYRSAEVATVVRNFLAQRPEYPKELRNKILQTADPLFRAAKASLIISSGERGRRSGSGHKAHAEHRAWNRKSE